VYSHFSFQSVEKTGRFKSVTFMAQFCAVFNFTIPRGDTGPAGPNSVTSATTSDGTATLSLSTLTVGSAATFNNTTWTYGTGAAAAHKTALAIASADITDATNLATANTVVKRNSSGNASFATSVYVGTTGIGATGTSINNYGLFFQGPFLGVTLNATSGSHTNSLPSTGGTLALASDIPPQEVKSANFTAADKGDYVVTATLTVTDTTPSEGASFSVLVRNGTATIGGTAYSVAGTLIRRVYHSGAWANYVYSSALFGANVATFLATPSSANLAAAVTDETGTGALVFGTSPTLTTPTINTSATFNATTYTYGTGAAAAHRAALSVYPEVAKIKSADESRTSTTYASDADLTVALEANSTYLITAYVDIIVNSGGAAFQFTYSGTLDAGVDVSEAFGIFTGNIQGRLAWSAITPPTAAFVSNSGTTPRTHNFQLIVKTSNAGDFAASWAAGAGNGTGSGNVTLKYLSYLTAKKIA